MEARLYTIRLSSPGYAARLMLEHKRIEYRVTTFPAGPHPLLVRLAGFKGYTVPVLKIDGRRVENSLAIARELERIRPEPALYPDDAAFRARVEDAERWGESEIQSLVRRMIRWALTDQLAVREWMARYEKLPAPAFQARTTIWLARRFANAVGATADRVRRDLAYLPAMLDLADGRVTDGTLSLEQPNAATFQVGTAIRALGMFPQLEPMLAERPSDDLARGVLPDYPQAPVEFPPEWLPSDAR